MSGRGDFRGSEPRHGDRGGDRGNRPTPRPGDWICPNCSNLVFASKSMCFKCNTPKPMDHRGSHTPPPAAYPDPRGYPPPMYPAMEPHHAAPMHPGFMAPAPGPVAPPPPPPGGRKIGAWSEYTDDSGKRYYHNEMTNVTQWDVPVEFRQENERRDVEDRRPRFDDRRDEMPRRRDREPRRDPEPRHFDDRRERDDHRREPARREPTPPVDGTTIGDWVEYLDEDGKPYYFNTVTEKTQWEVPEPFRSRRRGGGGGGGGGGMGGGPMVEQGERPGDWICPNCRQNCFASKVACFKCRTPRPDGGPRDAARGPAPRAGDWTCPKCSNNVFASKSSCFKCNTPRPGGGDRGDRDGPRGPPPPKPGDWTCPTCGANVFASKPACFKCNTPKPSEGRGSRSRPY